MKIVKTITVNPAKKTVAVVGLNLLTGTKSVGIARCCPDDEFDPEVGFCIAFTRMVIGSRSAVLRALGHSVKPSTSASSEPQTFELSKYLASHGMAQFQAAELCKVSPSTISRACFGHRLKVKSINLICEGLGLNEDQRSALLAICGRSK